MKVISHGLAGLAGLGFLWLASSAWGASASQSCPAGTRPGIDGCVDGSARAKVRAVRTDASGERSRAQMPAPDNSLRLVPDDRSVRDRARFRLLLLEIRRLESMLETTPRKAPDRIVIVRRLAEDYAELAAHADRDRVRAEIRAELEARRPPANLPRPASRSVF